MFEFLKKFGAAQPVTETQRQTVERALGEINEILAGLEDKPALRFDPVAGVLALELPEQMPDEAIALPAPEAEDDPDNTEAATAAKDTA